MGSETERFSWGVATRNANALLAPTLLTSRYCWGASAHYRYASRKHYPEPRGREARPATLSPQKTAQRYREFYGNNQELASEHMKEVVKATYYQRIDSLFVAIGHQQWGSFDPQNSKVQLHEQEQAGDEDLLDFAAIHTLLKGGTVFAVELVQVPAKSIVAAIFPY